MPRTIKGPIHHPLAAAVLIDLLHGYAEAAEPTTPLQKTVEAALAKTDPERRVAARLVKNFESLPEKIKTPVFGGFRPGQIRGASDDELAPIFARPLRSMVFRDDVSLGDPPTYPPGTQFTILYTGLYCKDRTGDRNLFGPSDEPYVITAAVSIEDGANVVRTELHPLGVPSQHYGDVDDGESREGPIAAVWAGPVPVNEISIVTVVMEHDEGDQDAYKEEIETIVNAAAALAAFYNLTIGAAIKAFARDLIIALIDSADDTIGTEVLIFTSERLRRFPHQVAVRKFSDTRTVLRPKGIFQYEIVEVVDNTNLDHQFVSRHTDRGEYVVTYKITASNEPVTPPRDLTAELGQEVLEVRNL